LSQPDHETDGQNGPEIFPNYEADRAIPFLRESFVLMHDSEARAQQMLDDAFGDLLGFLPGNFAARMILSAIANRGRDDSINLVGIGQCESPRCHCLRCAGTISPFVFSMATTMQEVFRRRPLRLWHQCVADTQSFRLSKKAFWAFSPNFPSISPGENRARSNRPGP
jgi:hypothetical protein